MYKFIYSNNVKFARVSIRLIISGSVVFQSENKGKTKDLKYITVELKCEFETHV